jgi:hypothetical protein
MYGEKPFDLNFPANYATITIRSAVACPPQKLAGNFVRYHFAGFGSVRRGVNHVRVVMNNAPALGKAPHHQRENPANGFVRAIEMPVA